MEKGVGRSSSEDLEAFRRNQHGVDHVYDAVRREHVGNRHAGAVDRDRVERHVDRFALDRPQLAFREVGRKLSWSRDAYDLYRAVASAPETADTRRPRRLARRPARVESREWPRSAATTA